MSELVTVDADLIRAEISTLQTRITRLRALLEGVDELRQFSPPSKRKAAKSNGRTGRPRDNPVYDKLRTFIGAQSGTFTSKEMRKAAHAPTRHAFGSAVRALLKDGVLVMEQAPMGRRPGHYRRIETKGPA